MNKDNLPFSTYDEDHTENMCDKCLQNVGKHNLLKVPFIYKDHNDEVHTDLGQHYHQYYVCKRCWKEV